MDEDRLDRLVGGGRPFDWFDVGDDAQRRKRAKGDGTYEQQFPGETQWAPSIHQQHLAKIRQQLEEEGEPA
ncbi:hypothetical protein [Nocardia sp. NPDC049707]|uniref:hypothetical protein n=1 Tax=Nocardia sp. NPDC049707 TaxID=3154735 RepID=UPI00343A4299